ncbi:MAG: hypothetical protein KDA92_15400 [Planctomycetales bacterium]|nr:hypothetical protein [Planctomycetales bacterium]
MKPVLCICIMLLSQPQTYAAVASYMEIFDGLGLYESNNGSFIGLNEPDWNISGSANSELNSTGLSFDADPLPNNIESDGIRMTREVEGIGSFRMRLLMNDLVFGLPIENLVSYVSVNCLVDLDPGPGSSVFVSLYATETNLRMSATSSGPFGTEPHMSSLAVGSNSSLGSVTRLEVTFDASHIAVALYGAGDEPMTLLLPYDGATFPAGHSTSCSAGATATGSVSGVFRELSEFPLDAAPGDFSGNGILDVRDINLLMRHLTLYDFIFDLNTDEAVDFDDLAIWVHDIRVTHFGDSDLNGEFDSTDLVNVFQSGQYEDEVAENSTWSSGDWNGDREFTSSDLVVAFQDGGYEQGRKAILAIDSLVPEPRGLMMMLIGIVGGLLPLRPSSLSRRMLHADCCPQCLRATSWFSQAKMIRVQCDSLPMTNDK